MSASTGGGTFVCRCGRPKEAPHDVCTACAWEQGWCEAVVVSGSDEAYGPHARLIMERVAACAEHLGRIRRQLAGEPNRRCVTDSASRVRRAAGRLVRACHDVERWLGQCGKPIGHGVGEDAWSERCVLEKGHTGAHRGAAADIALERARGVAEDLSRGAVLLADRLTSLFEAPRRLEEAGEHDELRRRHERLGAELVQLGRALALLGPGREGRSDGLVCWECGFLAASTMRMAEHVAEVH